MSSTETFGHFLLPLTMNKGHIETKVADHVFQVRGRYLELKESRPERHATRNFLGMLAFRIGKFEEALRYLDKILRVGEDMENLNALANRKYICEKLFRLPEARECERKIIELVTEDGTQECKNRCRRLRARSLAEQAFAYSFDLFGETVTVDRYCKSVEFYDRAITLAGHIVGHGEREDWAIVYGMACHKIYSNYKLDDSLRDQTAAWYQKAIDSFLLVIQRCRDCSLLSDSWRHLGELFKSHGHLTSIPENMVEYVKTPWKCFEKALGISPKDARILARYATHLQSMGEYSKAMDMVNKSIRLDDSDYNNHAYFVRAKLVVDEYKKQLKDFQKHHSQPPDTNVLKTAESDLKTALQNSSTPWHFHYMAEVLYYKAKYINGHAKQGDEERINLQLALTFCAKALAGVDGQKVAMYHKQRGECLCAMGEHQAALGCYKRAFECEHSNLFFGGSGHFLVIEFGHILEENTGIKDPYFLDDMVYWLFKVANICLDMGWTLWSLPNLKRLRPQWKAFVQYCKDNGYESKFQTIQFAAVDIKGRPEQSRTRRLFSAPAMTDTASPEKSIQRHQSYPATHSFDMKAPVLEPETAGVEHGENQGKVVKTFLSTEEARRDAVVSQGATASPEVPISDRIDKDVQTVTELMSQVDLDGKENNPIAADTIHVTYSVNLKTGQTQHVATRPSRDDPPAEVVSKEHVRAAPKRPLNHLERKYDFFVIYSSSASEWVQHRMLEELEGTGFKGCIKDRDFQLGKPRLDNYSDSIEDSVCVIIVITKDFETDNIYDVRGMHMAFSSDRLVVPVLLEDREMPPVLKPLEYLDATGAVDWPRLGKCIEQQVKLEALWDP